MQLPAACPAYHHVPSISIEAPKPEEAAGWICLFNRRAEQFTERVAAWVDMRQSIVMQQPQVCNVVAVGYIDVEVEDNYLDPPRSRSFFELNHIIGI